MTWNWQEKDWPQFTYNKEKLEHLESQFQKGAGLIIGSTKHLNREDKNILSIDIITNEALKTSEIEGEILNRESVKSSIRKQFGFQTDQRRSTPAEEGIAELMVDVYHSYAAPLTHEKLYAWHEMVTKGRRDLGD